MFGVRHDPEKAFGRKKNRAQRGAPEAKEWKSVDMEDKDHASESKSTDIPRLESLPTHRLYIALTLLLPTLERTS